MSKIKEFFNNEIDNKYDFSKLNPLDQVCMAVVMYSYAKKSGDCPSHLIFYNSSAYWNINGKKGVKLNGDGRRLLNFYKKNIEKLQDFNAYKEVYHLLVEETKNNQLASQEEQFLFYAKCNLSKAISVGDIEVDGRDTRISASGKISLVNNRSRLIYAKLMKKMQKEHLKDMEI